MRTIINVVAMIATLGTVLVSITSSENEISLLIYGNSIVSTILNFGPKYRLLALFAERIYKSYEK